MLLLHPSEGKAGGGDARGSTWSPGSGSLGSRLAEQRLEVVEALATSHGGNERLLGVTGDHLDPTSLPAAGRRRILVVSGLLGLV
jgi:hypothetical protein